MLNTYKKRKVLKGGRKMKREFLKSLGLEDEAIDKIIAENGKDIEATKAKADKSQEIENLKSELLAKDKLIEESNVQIQKFKEMDVDGIKAAAEEWKNKYTEFENQSKAEKEAYENKLKEQKYEFTLKEVTSGLKFPNELTQKAFLNELKAKNLPLEGDKLLGYDDYIKEVSEKNPGIFVTEEPKKDEGLPQLVKDTSGAGTPPQSGMNFNFTALRPRPKE
jgi:hypothetical protein